MTTRRGPVLLVALVLAAGACAPRQTNVPGDLPATIGGVVILYNVSSGADLEDQGPDSTASRVAAALSVPIDRVMYATGYRDDRSTYNSDIFQVRGAMTDELLEAVISTSMFTGERRTETIAGKSVIRATTDDGRLPLDSAPYFYAYDDVAIMFIGERPFIEEGLRALP
jgi:hypothetical protein